MHPTGHVGGVLTGLDESVSGEAHAEYQDEDDERADVESKTPHGMILR